MKFLNITAILGLITLPIIGCAKKANESVEQKNNKNKTYDFEIRDVEKMNFWFLNSTNSIAEVNIYKKDNSNLNEKLPELKNLNDFTFRFTKELQNNQDKQEKIRNLITTYGQKIKENSTYKTWVINKKITIKAQGTNLTNFKDFFDKTNYRLNETNNFQIETP
ncbi:hypothetical protein [Spiroplasma endosymbiont of 'Nebria riversi']|uniref:hypothetical protein n=1 Tax=Spiroplasma endosymbiont of 'Nebria riversi' TaxID=2792084 RepID=UPI001C050393|nr:hypothetical protein [Spiroplasma endosymbiont of 'Nebria riversi']